MGCITFFAIQNIACEYQYFSKVTLIFSSKYSLKDQAGADSISSIFPLFYWQPSFVNFLLLMFCIHFRKDFKLVKEIKLVTNRVGTVWMYSVTNMYILIIVAEWWEHGNRVLIEWYAHATEQSEFKGDSHKTVGKHWKKCKLYSNHHAPPLLKQN